MKAIMKALDRAATIKHLLTTVHNVKPDFARVAVEAKWNELNLADEQIPCVQAAQDLAIVLSKHIRGVSGIRR